MAPIVSQIDIVVNSGCIKKGLWVNQRSFVFAICNVLVPSLEWVCKFAYFNAVLALFLFVLRSVFLPTLPGFLQQTGILFAVCNVVFFVYDMGLSRLIGIYSGRLARGLGRMGK